MSLSVAVVTSTIGRSTLKRAIKSVKDQTRQATHYVFIHGSDYSYKAVANLEDDTVAVHLPWINSWCGYRMAPVYALDTYVNSDK